MTFPLFPGYVLGRFDLCQLHEVLTIPGVATVVRLAGRPAPIGDAEVENIRRFAAGLVGLDEQPEHHSLVDGQRVRVTGGPLEGVEGVVFLRGRRTSLLVGLRTIGHGIAVYLQSRLLHPVADFPRNGAPSPG